MKMKMKNSFLSSAILAAALGLSTPAFAQSDSQKKTPPAKQTKPAPKKPHKVWTDDEIGTLHSPANAYMDAKYSQADGVADSKEAAAAPKPKPHAGAPLLSNPKTVDDADKMIAWEKRDVDAQTEYVERLKKQIDEAPQEDKERLKKVLQDRIQILADTRGEMETLVQQKKELQKKAAANSNSATAQPPSQ
jgi:hypothetical protein